MQMNKEFEYRGMKFNIKVELNTPLSGSHKITLNHLGVANYYETDIVPYRILSATIKNMTSFAKVWADNRIDCGKSDEVLLLESLGFE
jgi:hypothetical protein